MTHRYIHLLALCISASSADAQLIYISDQAVRAEYNGWVPGCVDGSGYLDASFPGVASYDSGSAMLGNLGTVTIEGLDAFTSLSGLFINGATDITLQALPPALESMQVMGVSNGFAWCALPVTLRELTIANGAAQPPALPEGLEKLVVEDVWGMAALPSLPSTLLALEVYNCSELTALAAWPAGLQEFRIANCPTLPEIATLPPDLKHFMAGAMNLWEVVPDLPGTLESLLLDSSPILSLPPLPASLDSLVVSSTNVVEIPALPPSLTRLYVSNNPVAALPTLPVTLEVLSCYYAMLSQLPELPVNLRVLDLTACGNIQCLPPLPEGLLELGTLGTNLQCVPNIPPNIDTNLPVCSVLNSACPGDNPGVGGQVFVDADADGQYDVGEASCNFVNLQIEPIGMLCGVPLNGQYDFGVPIGDYTITPIASSPLVQSVSPGQHTAQLATQSSTDLGNDFGLVLETMQDLAVTITSDVVVPGFSSQVWITVSNIGSVVLDGVLNVDFDPLQTWGSSTIPPTVQNGNSATWNMDDLQLGEHRTVQVTLTTDGSLALGTPLTTAATLTVPVGDDDLANNAFVHGTITVGSFDPNDKTVTPSTLDQSQLAGAELTYTIRFQNTGTYHAQRVVITDTLSTSLDWTSFHFVASSHACNWTLHNGVLRFTFEPIFLPDSTNDEPNSHGFVTFTMRPDVSAGLGPIGNVANIYFDYNAPVITNEAVVDISTGISAEETEQLRVFPMPTQNTLWVERPMSTLAQFIVFDTQGRRMLSVSSTSALVALPVEKLPAGAYVVEVRDDKSTRVPFLKY